MSDRTAQKLIDKLRSMEISMDPANPDPIQIRQFRDVFVKLDEYLSNGGVFPNQWITKRHQQQILPHQELPKHDYTDHDNHLATCGHPRYRNTQHCGVVACSNCIDL